jgi:hypothetical protein
MALRSLINSILLSLSCRLLSASLGSSLFDNAQSKLAFSMSSPGLFQFSRSGISTTAGALSRWRL